MTPAMVYSPKLNRYRPNRLTGGAILGTPGTYQISMHPMCTLESYQQSTSTAMNSVRVSGRSFFVAEALLIACVVGILGALLKLNTDKATR